jgi:catechol 2,3-dioxygenase-like lactoylglutathione lyase family enzyme
MRTESDLNSPYSVDMDWKLELVMVPVTDVDRAKAFYTDKIGFNADHDHRVNEQLRFVQLTPAGSACSIAIGEGITPSAPGSAHLQIVVADVQAARTQLAERGVETGEVQDLGWGLFIFFKDPDGNSWALQQLPQRSGGERIV